MDEETRNLVRRRANEHCEYCGLPQEHSELRHHVEHIVAKQHGGTDDVENMALACHRCNLHKGANLTGVDPQTGELTRLFHPRQDRWSDHFEFEGVLIVGRTAVGRATAQVLDVNDPRRLELRTEIRGRRGESLTESDALQEKGTDSGKGDRLSFSRVPIDAREKTRPTDFPLRRSAVAFSPSPGSFGATKLPASAWAPRRAILEFRSLSLKLPETPGDENLSRSSAGTKSGRSSVRVTA